VSTATSISTGPFVAIGVDLGTESARVGAFALNGSLLHSEAVPYKTSFPKPGWAEQRPVDWWSSLGTATRQCIAELQRKVPAVKIIGIACDTTACSVVLLDKEKNVLRDGNCLLWCDARSSAQCERILSDAEGDPSLLVNCKGAGPLSAEWFIPKSLWVKENEPGEWDRAAFVCEKQDYINYCLTDRLCASGCNVAARWHWNAEHACKDDEDEISDDAASASAPTSGGRPVSLLHRIGLSDLLHKMPQECVPMGALVGHLTDGAAKHLGLPAGLPVTQGGPDAYVGMIGLGCVQPGKLALITGSSHLHLAVCEGNTDTVSIGGTDTDTNSNATDSSPGSSSGSGSGSHAEGVWGPYEGAPLLGLRFAEGGQSSTGSSLAWMKRLLNSNTQSQLHGPKATGRVEKRDESVSGHSNKNNNKKLPRRGLVGKLAAWVGKRLRALRRKGDSRSSSDCKAPQSTATSAPDSAAVPAAAVPSEVTYAQLDAEAQAVPIGSEGLLALETFQGQRTPTTDPKARGALLGLTLVRTQVTFV
jgi:ribulose kinase